MPRANRLLLPGYVWHITHRCHRAGVPAEVRTGPPAALNNDINVCDSRWVQALAVGSESFVTRFQLSVGGSNREIIPDGDSNHLGELPKPYKDYFGAKMVL